jgi:teichuronic acid biosynthesis glycosyltransferase TuaC
LRALVVSNMLPDAAHPERGRFVRDQVAALRGLDGSDWSDAPDTRAGLAGRDTLDGLDGLEVELCEFAPGARALAGAALELRSRFAGRVRGARSSTRGGRVSTRWGRFSTPQYFDVVHAHFGLTAWPALVVPTRVRALTVHGTDVRHPRTRVATAAVLPSIDLLAAASASLAQELPRRAARRAQVLPCGVDLERFRPLARAHARVELGLDPDSAYALFAADPARAEKRHDLALALAHAAGVRLLTLGGVDPERVPLWVNAANAVLVPSEREGFGLAVLEALACDVPVLATPVGIHRDALERVAGTLCAPFELERWRAALEPHVRAGDPRIEGRASAARFSARAMAIRVAEAWRMALAHSA